MVSIRDADIKDEWSRNEWGDYELWEKVEIRLRRRRWVFIGLTFIVFILISCFPIIQNRMPVWAGWAAAVDLSNEISKMKTSVSTDHMAYQIRFTDPVRLEYVVERAARCNSPVFQPVYSGGVRNRFSWKEIQLLTITHAQQQGIDRVMESFCYDPVDGAVYPGSSDDQESWSAFAFLVDSQISVLALRGRSAEFSWE